MADIDWVNIPVVAAAGADDEVVVVDLAKAAAQQARRIAVSALSGGVRGYAAAVTLAANQGLTNAYAAVGTGLSVQVPDVTGCVALLVGLRLETGSSTKLELDIQVRRDGVEVAVLQNVHDTDLAGSEVFSGAFYLDEPLDGAHTYEIRVKRGPIGFDLFASIQVLVVFHLS